MSADPKINGFQDIRENLLKDPEFQNFQRIIDGLWIGPVASVMKRQALKDNKITQVLKVNDTGEILYLSKWNIRQMNIYLEDHEHFQLDMGTI